MFYYLDGVVAELSPGLAVIDCGGVGYACRTTSGTLSALRRGQRGKLYTFLHVGDAIFDLYGFATLNELNSFRMLIGVSGVGPKAALSILSSGTPESVAAAIVAEDEGVLTAAAGVGKKLARRIILELKDKFSAASAADGTPVRASKSMEAAQALAALGYTAQEVSAALKGVDVEALPLEEILRRSLKKMAK